MGQSTSAACCICMEKKNRGVQCSSGHFTCKECFPQYINSTCENGGRLCDHGFLIRCPEPSCKSNPWTTTELRIHLDGNTLDNYINTLIRFSNKVAGGEQIHDIKRDSLVKLVTDALNLVCPKCKAVLDHNPEGCCAMRCSSCAAHFCWLCFVTSPTSVETHNHVRECPKNPSRSLFAPQHIKDNAHKIHRINRIRDVLNAAHIQRNQVNIEWRAAPETLSTLAQLAPLLAQSQISSAEILARNDTGQLPFMRQGGGGAWLRLWTAISNDCAAISRGFQRTPLGRYMRPFLIECDAIIARFARRDETAKAYTRFFGLLVFIWFVYGRLMSSSANNTVNNVATNVLPSCPVYITEAQTMKHQQYLQNQVTYHMLIPTSSVNKVPKYQYLHKPTESSSYQIKKIPQVCIDKQGVHIYQLKNTAVESNLAVGKETFGNNKDHTTATTVRRKIPLPPPVRDEHTDDVVDSKDSYLHASYEDNYDRYSDIDTSTGGDKQNTSWFNLSSWLHFMDKLALLYFVTHLSIIFLFRTNALVDMGDLLQCAVYAAWYVFCRCTISFIWFLYAHLLTIIYGFILVCIGVYIYSTLKRQQLQ